MSDLKSTSDAEHDFKLLEDLVNQDSIRMHESSIEVSRHRRETEEEMKVLKKTPTKKPTQLIKQKPTSVPFKSTTVTPTSHSEVTDLDHHNIPASLASDGNTFFAPEDVTLPPNTNGTVSNFYHSITSRLSCHDSQECIPYLVYFSISFFQKSIYELSQEKKFEIVYG
jgi:hypothetical protein